LFKGARPVVTSSPSSITYGESFFVDTPDAMSIAAVTLVRLSAVTHAFNMNQRFLRLAFTQAPGRLTVTAPSVAEIAPPGHYMLFVLNAAGVPSIAPIIRVNSGAVASAPAAPTNLSATAVSSSRINLAWTDNASNESGFRIERSADGATYTEIGVVTANVTTYADTSLSAATQYWYRVRAYNATGPSAFAGPTSATTLSSSQPPSAPTGLVAARQSGRITLAWTDSSNNETGFSIERSVDGRAFSPIATVAQNVSTYVDTSPGSSKFVFYRVRAFNLAGNSAYSNVIKVRNN
jgi:predicted phage tail protein